MSVGWQGGRPGGFTLFTLLLIAVLVALGGWQLRRLAWKTDLIRQVEAGLAAPAVALDVAMADADSWMFRRVTVSGRFREASSFFFASRVHNGQIGWGLVTPLVWTDLAGREHAVLVDRGWVPLDRAYNLSTEAQVVVQGIAWRPPGSQGLFQPDNNSSANVWFWVDLQAMAKVGGLVLVPVVVVAEAMEGTAPPPVAEPFQVNIPNDHLGYAMTWFALAVVILGMWIVHCRTRPVYKDT